MYILGSEIQDVLLFSHVANYVSLKQTHKTVLLEFSNQIYRVFA